MFSKRGEDTYFGSRTHIVGATSRMRAQIEQFRNLYKTTNARRAQRTYVHTNTALIFSLLVLDAILPFPPRVLAIVRRVVPPVARLLLLLHDPLLALALRVPLASRGVAVQAAFRESKGLETKPYRFVITL